MKMIESPLENLIVFLDSKDDLMQYRLNYDEDLNSLNEIFGDDAFNPIYMINQNFYRCERLRPQKDKYYAILKKI